MIKSLENPTDVPFSMNVLIMVFVLKPIFDLFFFIDALKYLYMGLLFLSGAFAFFGSVRPYAFSSASKMGMNSHSNYSVIFFLLFSLYVLFLFSIGMYTKLDSNAISEIIKIISPFITVGIMVVCSKYDIRKKIATFLAIVVLVNFISLPFGFSWVMWGSVKTFKGFYYFKMDLAFSLLNCLVIYYFSTDRFFNKRFISLSLMVVVMIVLSNSRLNYLLLFLFFSYVAFVQGISLRSLVRIAILVAVIGLLVMFLYNPDKFISPFDVSNMDSFTQGRNHIWALIIDRGLLDADFFELLFGQGLFSDLELSNAYARSVAVHDAHNELLHLLMTQGVVGLFIYVALWFISVKYMLQNKVETGCGDKLFISMIFLFFVIQGVTAVISPFYLKTWWLVCCLVVCCGSNINNRRNGSVVECG